MKYTESGIHRNRFAPPVISRANLRSEGSERENGRLIVRESIGSEKSEEND